MLGNPLQILETLYTIANVLLLVVVGGGVKQYDGALVFVSSYCIDKKQICRLTGLQLLFVPCCWCCCSAFATVCISSLLLLLLLLQLLQLLLLLLLQLLLLLLQLLLLRLLLLLLQLLLLLWHQRKVMPYTEAGGIRKLTPVRGSHRK